MRLIETRGNDNFKPSQVSFSEAILSPIASFGGLYVPSEFPKLDDNFFEIHKNSSYKDLALDVLHRFGIDIESEVIKEALTLYDNFDDANNPVPVVKVEENLFVAELYHGPTRAFKDMALQPFGSILSHLAKDKEEHYLILAATSGDTGPATLETFKNKENIKVVCLYPNGKTSDVQRLQMVTEDGANLKVIGIDGDFDDAQNALKNLLASREFKHSLDSANTKLSAANSVNFGRIIFQTIYHIHAYLEMMRQGEVTFKEQINISVPSGNFGNALGGYYAKKMGLPIDKILIASNENNILTALINNGEYNFSDKKLILTSSPAMDILKSSNVERVLFDKFGAVRTKELMRSLEESGFYKLTIQELDLLQEDFLAEFSTGDEVIETIQEYAQKEYILDPHTATNIKCFKASQKIYPDRKVVAYSTAEWTKFAPTMYKALVEDGTVSDVEAIEALHAKLGINVPDIISALFDKEVVHADVVKKADISEEILKFI